LRHIQSLSLGGIHGIKRGVTRISFEITTLLVVFGKPSLQDIESSVWIGFVHSHIKLDQLAYAAQNP